MRSVRTALGLAVALCAFGTFAAPALAKKAKPPIVFGKFVASYPNATPISPATPALAKGHGELDVMSLADGALHIEECEDVKSRGEVTEENSESFFQNVTFAHCLASIPLGKGLTEQLPVPKFTLGMEFRSNKSVEVGEGAPSETEIVKPSTVIIPIGKKAPCAVTIPQQIVPSKAATKAEREYGAAAYTTEKEEASLKKFPLGYQERLAIDMEFTKVESWVKPNEHCVYAEGEDGSYDSTVGTPAYGYVVYSKGFFEAELEEITIKHGNLGFEPVPEV